MRRISALMLGTVLVIGSAALAGCSSSSGSSDSTDGSDGTTGTTGTAGTTATDGTSGTTATDGTTGTDATTGTTGTTGTDGTSGTTGTDATSGTTGTTGTDVTDICEPFCQPGWACGDDGCNGSCGAGCSGELVCNPSSHQCEDPPPPVEPPGKFGEPCGPTPACNSNLDAMAYDACLNAQCESGLCLESVGFGADGLVCSKPCNMQADQVDAAGNPGPDGIEDPGGLSDCGGALDGPFGTNFACVALIDPNQNQGNTLNLCSPGTTFKNCIGNSDCPSGETCQLRFINSDYRTVCMTAPEGSVGVGEPCNGNPLDGEVSICANGICFGFGCGGFCNDDADCQTDPNGCQGGTCTDGSACTTDAECSAFQCELDQAIFGDAPELTWNQCRGLSCETNKDCKTGYYCIPFVNGADTVEEYDYEPACGANPVNGSDLGGPCGDTQECNGLCLNSGVCSGICKEDADCANDTTEMICGASPQGVDIDGDEIDDKVLHLGLCLSAAGSKADCFTDTDCANTGDNEICNFFLLQDSDTGAVDAKGFCTETQPGEADVGEPCGGPTGVNCKSGYCLSSSETQPGYCSTLCAGIDTCPASFTFGMTEYVMACRGLFFSDGLSLTDNTDNVYVPLCVVFGVAGESSLADCSTDLTCGDGEACIGQPWGFGATGPADMDFVCASSADADGNAATGEFADVCDPTGETGVSCKNIYCAEDSGGSGYCTKLCNEDADCAGGTPDMVCHSNPFIERADPADSVYLSTCVKKKSCIPCTQDSGCAGGNVCVNIGTGGVEDRVCAPPCSTDGDCGATDGGSTCVESLDASGAGEGKSSCAPTCG